MRLCFIVSPSNLLGGVFCGIIINVMKRKKVMIVMMGGQGVGKGTFSKMLMAHHDFLHIEVGAMLRALPPESDVAKIIATGNLVSDDLLFGLMDDTINVSRDVILDGFPRKLSQAKWLVENYSKKFNIFVLYLAVTPDVLVARINKRIREGGGRRDDANPDAIRRRLSLFYSETMPAIEYLRNNDTVHFAEIDATGDIDENFSEITNALKNMK